MKWDLEKTEAAFGKKTHLSSTSKGRLWISVEGNQQTADLEDLTPLQIQQKTVCKYC